MLLSTLIQEDGYHAFADQRAWLGLPNFLNVISNAPFLLVGALGLLKRRGAACRVLFSSVALTGFGSAYYHLAPNTPNLFYDRLPLAVVFMAMFALVIGRCYGEQVGRVLLWPLVAAGVASVVWWRVTSDLRFYALVQFVPMLMVPLLLAGFRPARSRAWWGVVSWYALAKLFELFDRQLFAALGGIVSGHTLKHLAAALATWAALGALTAPPRESEDRPG